MKTKISLLLLIVSVLISCQQNGTSGSKIKDGMIKMAIFYPNGLNKTFDMDYYKNKHMPMAAGLLGESMKAMTIDEGFASGPPNSDPPYKAIGYFYFDTMADFKEAMGPHEATIKADVANYTNIQPIIQFSQVILAE